MRSASETRNLPGTDFDDPYANFVGDGVAKRLIDPAEEGSGNTGQVGPGIGTGVSVSGAMTRTVNNQLSIYIEMAVEGDCADIFDTLGVSPEKFLAKLNTLRFFDGTASRDKVETVVNEPYAKATGVLGWTVADLFRNNFPGAPANTRIDGWTPPLGLNVYLRPGHFDAATIAHETFHKFPHIFDKVLLQDFNLKEPSSEFTKYFKKKCL